MIGANTIVITYEMIVERKGLTVHDQPFAPLIISCYHNHRLYPLNAHPHKVKETEYG